MSKSQISWTDATWNPFIGCTPISEACSACWARREEDGRFRHLERCGITMGLNKEDAYFFRGPVYQGDDVLNRPLHWKKPRRVFVCSRSDLFHESIPFEQIDRVFAVMALCPQHTFILLTKRAERMFKYNQGKPRIFDLLKTGHFVPFARGRNPTPDIQYGTWPLPNIWLGVTVENQARADERIPWLLKCPAAVRWVSYEPALDKVYWDCHTDIGECDSDGHWLKGIVWIVAGGESGKNARPANPDWFRHAYHQCKCMNVAFYMKQMSGNTAAKRKAIPEDLMIREYPDGR